MPEELSLFRWPEAILGLLGTHCVAAKTWTSTLTDDVGWASGGHLALVDLAAPLVKHSDPIFLLR